MGEGFSAEFNLAQQLKQSCNERGIEKNPFESAKILNKFGVLYKQKTPDKVCLIQSAAFLNAAIVRQPSNEEFKEDLNALCSHVLQVADAKDKHADLTLISCQVFDKVKAMRDCTNEGLEKLKKISLMSSDQNIEEVEKSTIVQVRNLQTEIAADYTNIMHYISNECLRLKGDAPCKFSITGLGSLARKEITPFSDFEHVIVLEEGVQYRKDYNSVLEFFRWFSVVFHIIVINLKETIVKSVAVPWLNNDGCPGGDWFYDNFTTCGIKFDGMQLHACKIPLGRTRISKNKKFTIELIKPVSEMVQFLEVDEDIKNGYHLADVLTKTCFVSGCRDVHDQFQKMINRTLLTEQAIFVKQIDEQMKEHLDTFNIARHISSLNSAPSCDIKRAIYRTVTMFMSTLARLHSIEDQSCFDIVDRMEEKTLICPDTAHKLLKAIAFACSTRLKVYMLKGGQEDIVGQRNFHDIDRKTLEELYSITGEENLADYFITASCLRFAIRYENLEPFGCKFSHKFVVMLGLDLRDLIISKWQEYLQNNTSVSHDEDMTIRYTVCEAYKRKQMHGKALEVVDFLDQQDISSTLKMAILRNKAQCLLKLRRYDDTMRFIEETKDRMGTFDIPSNLQYTIPGTLYFLDGECKRHSERFDEAIISYKEALTCFNHATNPNSDIPNAHCGISLCLMQISKPREAIESANRALALCVGSQFVMVTKCNTYRVLGLSHFMIKQFHKALYYFQTELKLRTTYGPDKQEDNEQVACCKFLIKRLARFLPRS